jgi:SH3-like domain-containing protein
MNMIRHPHPLVRLLLLPALAGTLLAGAAETVKPAPATPPAAPTVAATPPATVPASAAAVPAATTAATLAAPATTPPAPAAPVAGRPGKVIANVLNVRARPGLNYERVAVLKRDDPVTVVGESEEWLEIAVPAAAEAWVSSHFLDLPSSKVKADRLRVHAGPSGVYSTYGFIERGFVVKPQGEPDADGWLKIEAPATATVWVNRKFVEFQGEVPKSSNPAANVPPLAADKPLVVTGPVKVDDKAPAQDPEANPALSPEETQPMPGPNGTTATPVLAGAPVPAATVPVPATATAPAPPPFSAPAATTTNITPATATIAPPPHSKAATPPPALAAPAAKAAAPAVPGAVPEPSASPIAAPATVASPARVASLTTTKEGVITSLGMQASGVASHLLSLRQGNTLYPVCYLNSKKIELVEWEGRKVRVYGREVQYPHWKRPVLDVAGIQALPEK